MTTQSAAVRFVRVPVDHPANPAPGGLCRVGTTVGIRVYDSLYEQLGGDPTVNKPMDPVDMEYVYGNGEMPVSFGPITHQVKVRNQGQQGAVPGAIVRYFDRPLGPVGHEANCAVQEASAIPDATVGILLEKIPSETTQKVAILMQYAPRDWHWLSCPAVERTPGLCSGAWVFKGTRIPIHHLFQHLILGDTVQDFLLNFPGVSEQQVHAVLQHEIMDLSKYADPLQQYPFPSEDAAPRQ